MARATVTAAVTVTDDDPGPVEGVVPRRADHTTTYYKAGGESTKDRAQASTLTVSAGQKSSGVDGSVADLVKSQVGGIVRTTAGAPISGAEIRFYTRNAADAGTGTGTYTPALGTGPAAGTTGSAGTWKVERDFAPYVVEVRAPAYGTFYYKGSSIVSDPASAEEVQVKEGVARRLDAALGNASTTTISGTVTTAGGQPVQGVTISVETGTTDASGTPVWTEVQKTKAKTGPSGGYSANVPPGGNYVVGFHAPGFETQYFNGKPSQTSADKVATSFAEPKAGVNATLTRVAQVIGTVRDNAGSPLQGVRVTPVVFDPETALVPAVHATDGTLAVRVPRCDIARRLADLGGHPITATSANRAGITPSATGRDVVALLGPAVELILEQRGRLTGKASTIVDTRGAHPVLLRDGAVPWNRVLQSLA